ncbi:hypothetical protein CFBP6626_00345 [Agrobacterium tumefaciens]|nr:hypothetical protein CFBP6626_00345 [Agrobacterium tumefaciens]CUX41078.1 Peptidase U35 phage prohead HK97 [Agrobacterium genomosp. 5 str. CFBP 6626]
MATALRKAKDDSGLRRTWGFQPETLNEEERTIWVVAATETPVRRYYGDEILLCTRKAVVATRLKNMPVLDSHRSTSVKDILGQVIETRFEGRQLHMKVRFADNDNGNAALGLVRDGMLHKVSAGYRILEAEESTGRDGVPVITVTRWEPTEISLVSVPADPNATIRGNVKMAKKPTTTRRAPVEDILDEDIDIGHDEDGDERPAPVGQRSFSVADVNALMSFRSLAAREGISDQDFTDMVTRSNGSMDRFRRSYMKMLADRSDAIPIDSRVGLSPQTGLSRENGDIRNMVVDALAVRLGAAAVIQNNPLAGSSSVEIGRRYLEENGVSTRNMDDHRIADVLIAGRQIEGVSSRGQHTTSDFPLLLQTAGNRALLQRYEPLVSPLKSLSSMRHVRDFRQQTFIRPGEAPLLEKVLESGAIKHGTMEEDSRGLKLETYARMFNISRNALVNDDLGAFSDFLGVFAQAAAETEGNLFASLLLANNKAGLVLGDGLPLFHPDRNNVSWITEGGTKKPSGSAITVDSVGAARMHMRTHKNVNGTGTAGVVPAVLLVGPAQETEAEKLVASINAATISDTNPFAGKLRVAVENRLDGNGWYLFADPGQRPALMHGYLDGASGPQVESKEGWDILGTSFRCILDFGCGVLDWRSAYFNPGQ